MSAKAHVFEPSGRRILTVVGHGGEHWVDPEMRVCSCASFHYRGSECQHVAAALLGAQETVEFSDDEFDAFIEGLLGDIWAARTAK